MAPRKRKDDGETADEGVNKEDEKIARYIRFNTPSESTMFKGNEVYYFTGSKAVDILVDSQWGTKAKGSPRFPDRRAATRFLEELLEHQLFWRAKKLIPKSLKEKEKDRKKGEETDANKSPRPTIGKKKKDLKDDDEANDNLEDAKDKPNDKEEKDEKKKKKVRLEPHNVQVFNDANDVYVWIFDPTPWHKKAIGVLMVLGTIAGCLFPLWPVWLRQGVYYLSIAAIGAFGAIIVTAILRTILFGIIWVVTWGKHHLWILPNLTEDCGFFESFQPLYTYEYRPDGKAPPKEDKKKKKKDGGAADKEDSDEKKESTENDKQEEISADKESEDENAEGEGSSRSVSCSESDGADVDASHANGDGHENEAKVRRRVRRDDDGFVVVNN